MSADTDWCVNASDDEWEDFINPDDRNDEMFIPQSVALLLPLLSEQKILPIKCYCPRKGEQQNDAVVSVVEVVDERKQTEGSRNVAVSGQETNYLTRYENLRKYCKSK